MICERVDKSPKAIKNAVALKALMTLDVLTSSTDLCSNHGQFITVSYAEAINSAAIKRIKHCAVLGF